MTNTKPAKLTRNPDADGYCWAAGDSTTWVIVKENYWDASKGKTNYYRATNEGQGLTFDTDTLKEMRERLPQVDVAYTVDGTRLAGVDKTPQRLEREKRERPNEEKLAAADQQIVNQLKSRKAFAVQEYEKFLAKMNEGIESVAYNLRWNGSDVARQSYLVQRYNYLLDGDEGSPSNSQERKDHIVRVHAQYQHRLTEMSFHDTKVKADLHGVVEHEERRSVVEFFNLLDSFLVIYNEEYVEDVPKPVRYLHCF